MKATVAAKSLSVFSSYDESIEFSYDCYNKRFYLFAYEVDKLKSISAIHANELNRLGWKIDSDGYWVFYD